MGLYVRLTEHGYIVFTFMIETDRVKQVMYRAVNRTSTERSPPRTPRTPPPPHTHRDSSLPPLQELDFGILEQIRYFLF